MSTERDDLITMLDGQREMFRIAVTGVSDEQARSRSTVSELTLGGLLHHLGATERHWLKVIADKDENAEFDTTGAATAYVMTAEQTLADQLAKWEAAAAATNQVIHTHPNLDELVPLPTAPWQPEREWWTVRQVLLHIYREVAHHSGHADIIREAIDGQNTTYTRAGIDPEQAFPQ
ncbi:MAG: DUF664 domain-containing protein [Mycobacteriaceae bacterium]|nr:DUF664 domain-containing protein [Mycobacteriaceae bacterium]